MTLGLSISGAVFINTAEKGLAKALPNIPREKLAQVVAGASNDMIASLSPELRTAAFEVIVSSWQKVFICVYVAAAVSLIASILLRVSQCLIACLLIWFLVLTYLSTERPCQHQGRRWRRLNCCLRRVALVDCNDWRSDMSLLIDQSSLTMSGIALRRITCKIYCRLR